MEIRNPWKIQTSRDVSAQDGVRAETARLVAAVPPEGLRRLLARKAAKVYPGGLARATRACGYSDDSRWAEGEV